MKSVVGAQSEHMNPMWAFIRKLGPAIQICFFCSLFMSPITISQHINTYLVCVCHAFYNDTSYLNHASKMNTYTCWMAHGRHRWEWVSTRLCAIDLTILLGVCGPLVLLPLATWMIVLHTQVDIGNRMRHHISPQNKLFMTFSLFAMCFVISCVEFGPAICIRDTKKHVGSHVSDLFFVAISFLNTSTLHSAFVCMFFIPHIPLTFFASGQIQCTKPMDILLKNPRHKQTAAVFMQQSNICSIMQFPNSISTANHPWKNKNLIVISFEHFHIFNNCLDFTFVCLLLLRRLLVPSSSDPSFVGLLCLALLTEVQQIQMNFARRYFPTNAKNVICIPNFLTYNVNGSPYNP